MGGWAGLEPDPQFQNTVVWVRLTVTASVVPFAGAKKQEDWSETTRRESAAALGIMNRICEC